MKRSMLDDATLLAVFSHGTSRPLHVAEIAQSLGFPLSERHRLSEALEVLAERGLLSQLPGARFRRKRDDGVRLEGRFSQNPRGFAFVSASDGGADVYVPGNSIAGAMHGDLVVVLATEGPRGPRRRGDGGAHPALAAHPLHAPRERAAAAGASPTTRASAAPSWWRTTAAGATATR